MKSPILNAALCAAGLWMGNAFAAQISGDRPLDFKPSDNGSDTRAFVCGEENGAIRVDFSDQSNADNYLHIDFGSMDLTNYYPGGYLEIDAELDAPILRIAASIAEPKNFWPTRVFIEQEAYMKAGRHTYRIYFDTMPAPRVNSPENHLYLFLHDMGGESKGKAKLTIHNTRLVKPSANWQEEKNACYKEQYNWRNFLELGRFYRGEYGRVVPMTALDANAFIKETSLNGEFEKSYLGDITWKYDQLADTSFARPGTPLPGAVKVMVPETAVEQQPGGHYLYKKNFHFDGQPGEKVYLRIGDLADYAEIFINGRRVGSQTSTRRRHEWVLENGSRQSNTWGKPVKEVVRFQHFERMACPVPFRDEDMPDDHTMMLPIYTGEYPWNYAFEISDLVKSGENTLAIRLYGNPVTGWWIYRHTDDRAYRNVFGVLGDVTLLTEALPVFSGVASAPAGRVAPDGTVVRRFTGKVSSRVKSLILTGAGQRQEAKIAADGTFAAELTLPTNFDRTLFTLTAFAADGRAIDSWNVETNNSVMELRDGKLFVNGDPFVIRGINGDMGIEWENDRRQTRRRWLQMLATYKQLGFNALRLEGVQPQQVQDALDYGFLVMPVYAAGSCNTTEVALGNLEKPDHEFNTDAHKEMALLLANYPNIVFWNSGNENHHTPGYNDKVLMDQYLAKAEQELHRFDPDQRPVTYANLDTYGTHWFFTAGQGVLGYNSYQYPDLFTKMMKRIYQETGMPLVFCEWGLLENETKGTALRNRDIDQWEVLMRQKLDAMRDTKGCVGGFLYAHHGEFKDLRGREFLQQVMSPFKLVREGDTIKFENQDVATLRKVNVQLVTPDNVAGSEWLDELKPGRSLRISCPPELAADAALQLEISFETHRGLPQKYTRMVNRIPVADAGKESEK